MRPAEACPASEEGADHFRSSAVFLTAAHPKQTEGSDVESWDIDRSDLRATIRPGHAAAVDSAVYRERGLLRRVRLQLQLRLLRHDQLVLADDSAADDDRSAHGVRNALRRRRITSRSRCPPESESQHSRRDHARGRPAPKGSGTERSKPAQHLSGRCSRDRTAYPENRAIQRQRRVDENCRRRRSACRIPGKSTSN